jgi:hypothetical protein
VHVLQNSSGDYFLTRERFEANIIVEVEFEECDRGNRIGGRVHISHVCETSWSVDPTPFSPSDCGAEEGSYEVSPRTRAKKSSKVSKEERRQKQKKAIASFSLPLL